MKIRSFFIVLSIFLPFSAHSQQLTWNKTYQEYFNTYQDAAIEQMLAYGIPASITLAQGVLESGAGKSELARYGNNHFGIKCNGWTGRKQYHDDDARGECFRAYDSAYESYVDHSKFLSGNKRYSSLFHLKTTDYKGWAKGLKACGYATNPVYAKQLISIIELYGLHELDHSKVYNRRNVRGLSNSAAREVHEFNSNEYIIAKEGDSFSSIAEDMNMSARALARINENNVDAAISEGDYIWLKKKRRHAPKEYKNWTHTVSAGESMYSISQHYGIRLKNLYKINHLSPDAVIHVGDALKVR